MKIRFFAVVFIVLSVFFLSNAAVHASDNISKVINGERVDFLQPPVIVDGTTLVPVRGVFENIGYDVEWLYDTRSVRIRNSLNEISITIGSGTFYTNGVAHSLDVPAQIINDRAMLPFRALLESVNYAVDWDGETETIIITTPATAPATRTEIETLVPTVDVMLGLMPDMGAAAAATASIGSAGVPIDAEISVLETETHLFAEIFIPHFYTHTTILPKYPIFVESIVARPGDVIAFDLSVGAGEPRFGFSTFRFDDMACRTTWGNTTGVGDEHRDMSGSFNFALESPGFLYLSSGTIEVLETSGGLWTHVGEPVGTYMRVSIVIERAEHEKVGVIKDLKGAEASYLSGEMTKSERELMGTFFHTTETAGGRIVERHNQEAIDKHLGTFGYFMLMPDHVADAHQALEIYRNKDVV